MTSSSTKTSPDLRRRYEQDGYVIVRDAIDPTLVQEARSHIEWLLRQNPDTQPEKLDKELMTDDPFWVRLVADERLLDIAEQFVGPNIGLFASHYIAKPPYKGQAVLWHQDGSYWPLEPMEVITFWLAVDDSTPENGCLRVIPGTHALDLQETKSRTDVKNVLESSIDDAFVDESEAVDLVLRPGDISIHHPNIIHGSNANTSPHWRRGLTIRYIPASTRILTGNSDGSWPSAFLLRGEPVPAVNNYNPWPAFVGGKHMPFHGWPTWNEQRQQT